MPTTLLHADKSWNNSQNIYTICNVLTGKKPLRYIFPNFNHFAYEKHQIKKKPWKCTNCPSITSDSGDTNADTNWKLPKEDQSTLSILLTPLWCARICEKLRSSFFSVTFVQSCLTWRLYENEFLLVGNSIFNFLLWGWNF